MVMNAPHRKPASRLKAVEEAALQPSSVGYQCWTVASWNAWCKDDWRVGRACGSFRGACGITGASTGKPE